MAHLDQLGRPLLSLRLSVTDRCNLRCRYCMPEKDYVWIPRDRLLSFEEISTVADIFLSLGVTDIRLTGGEPLLRKELHELVAVLAAKPGLRDLALTTNGVLLAEHAAELHAAGLRRMTISLDTLRADRYRALSGADDLSRTLAGIQIARAVGFGGTKLNSVIVRGVNDDELADLLDYGRAIGAEVRFIEYMDVGGATQWTAAHVVSRREMLDVLAARFGEIEPIREGGFAPAQRFRLRDGTCFGVIASTTEPFCRTCDRARLTADGMFYLCLYAMHGINLRDELRGGASLEDLRERLRAAWLARADRGAELRAVQQQRGPFVSLPQLRGDYHLEMHTRGG